MADEIIDIKLTERDEERVKRTIDFEGFLEKNKLSIGALLLGLILLGIGVLGLRIFSFNSGPKVEVLGEGVEEGKSEVGSVSGVGNGNEVKIIVEAAGEVIKPGVYKLEIGSRVNDLLMTAGGLSANADREWVEKNINLALKLADGVKIYIPGTNLSNSSNLSNLTNLSNKININTASETKLIDALLGVGPATAKKIIAGRPFQRPEELLEKKIVKSNVWEEIKDKITVY